MEPKERPEIGSPAWIENEKAEAIKFNSPEKVEQRRERIRKHDEARWGLTLSILTTVREYRHSYLDPNERIEALQIALYIYTRNRDIVFGWMPPADAPGGVE